MCRFSDPIIRTSIIFFPFTLMDLPVAMSKKTGVSSMFAKYLRRDKMDVVTTETDFSKTECLCMVVAHGRNVGAHRSYLLDLNYKGASVPR